VTVSRQDVTQPRPVVEAALRADPSRLPALVGVDLGGDGYAVVKVNKVVARDVPAAQQAVQERDTYTRAWAMAEGIAYYNTLKERYKAQVLVPKPTGALPGQ
jgi:peptidyl-prolyl cis-trans isomerase D